jgi:5-methylcytosine-specific restriction endonuclease McrA
VITLVKCTRCGNEYEQTHFNQKYCITCRPIVRKKQTRKADAKWNKKHKAKRKQIRKAYYDKHPWSDLTDEEKTKELQRKRDKYWENPELSRQKEREKYRKWVSTKRGRFLQNLKNHTRRGKEKVVIHQFTPEQWKEKIETTGGICPMCKENVGIENLELDHIIPLAKAKENQIYTIDDIQPLCRTCNRRKKDN